MILTVRYEYARVFTRVSIIVFISIITVSLYFTFQGISEYNIFFEHKRDFIAAEKGKISFYFNYEQYAAAGFRVILEPSPLSVFFNNQDFTRDIEARIDTSEIISLYNGRKGRKAFSMDGRFGDLNQTITIFGALLMMVMGFLSFPNKFHIEFFKKGHQLKTILARLLLLDIFFILLLFANYAFARGLGVSFLPTDKWCFVWYGVTALLFLDAFFLYGIFIKAICRYKKISLIVLMISWFMFIFIFPEMVKVYRSIRTKSLPSEEKLDIEKLKTLLDNESNIKQSISHYLSKHNLNSEQERQDFQNLLKNLFQNYIDNDYVLVKKKEEDFFMKVKQDIDIFSRLSIFFPVDFLNYISAEASGKGYTAYIDFFQYVVRIRDQFMRFCGQKRSGIAAAMKQVNVISFIKNSENIYYSPSRLTKNLAGGLTVIFIYLVILSTLSCYQGREKKNAIDTPGIISNFKHGQILFLLVNKKKQAEIAGELKKGMRSILHRASHLILNKEVSARLFINYACQQNKIKRNKVIENLELLGVKEKDLHKKLSLFQEESKRKLICSLVFAEDNEVIIINDFIKGASYEFEQQFLNLINREANNNRKIIYIGSEIYSPGSSLIKSDIKIKTYQPFHLDPQKVSLR